MVSKIRWGKAYRVISSVYPTRSVYDRITGTSNFAQLLELEALTNPRVYEEAGNFRKIRPADAISGPGTTPIMASFAYSGPSRFCDGSYGVYYAAHEEQTALAESLYHTEKRLREWHEPSGDQDKRVYVATIAGQCDDVRAKTLRTRIYQSDSYDYSQRYAAALYRANMVDGIVYNSVRHSGGQCVAAFRPRMISSCRVHRYVQFRWDGTRIVAVAQLTDIREYD